MKLTIKLEEILHMNGGDGDTSYAANSRLQEIAILETKFLLQQVIVGIYKDLRPETLAVADLGCSSGPNTMTVVSEIIEAIGNECQNLGGPPPEVQFFLNDLPGNDFNNIFRSLPSFVEKVEEQYKVPFYVVGVPGSFYERRFPKKSIHLVHSSYSLHWLSQVPRIFGSDTEVLLNKWNIYIAKSSPPQVLEWYLKQFRGDFAAFLKLRSVEVISKGCVVLTFHGRKKSEATDGEYCYLWGLLADALKALVSEGTIQEEELDTFNVPLYTPSMEEVHDVIKIEGSFELKQQNVFETNWDAYDDDNEDYRSNNFVRSGENVAKCIRAVAEPMIANHFGKGIIKDLFSRYAENVAKHLCKEKTKFVQFVLYLKKRG